VKQQGIEYEVNYSAVVMKLTPDVAQLAGHDWLTQYACMECGERIGGKQLIAHAKHHAVSDGNGAVAPAAVRNGTDGRTP
jgi:hypothetical protein